MNEAFQLIEEVNHHSVLQNSENAQTSTDRGNHYHFPSWECNFTVSLGIIPACCDSCALVSLSTQCLHPSEVKQGKKGLSYPWLIDNVSQMQLMH